MDGASDPPSAHQLCTAQPTARAPIPHRDDSSKPSKHHASRWRDTRKGSRVSPCRRAPTLRRLRRPQLCTAQTTGLLGAHSAQRSRLTVPSGPHTSEASGLPSTNNCECSPREKNGWGRTVPSGPHTSEVKELRSSAHDGNPKGHCVCLGFRF